MTKGRIYLKTKRSGWAESPQLPCDMGYELPYGHGTDIISGFLRNKLTSRKKLITFIKNLFQQWNIDRFYTEDDYDLLRDLFGQQLRIDGIGDDYSYIMNCSAENETIIVAGTEIEIQKDEMIVLYFSDIVLRLKRKSGKKRFMLSEEETYICIEALDFYSRVLIGQYDNIISRLSWRTSDTIILENRYVCENILAAIRCIVMKKTDLGRYDFHASIGIWNDITDRRAVNAYDIQQVIRNRLAYARHPEGGHTVDFREPLIMGDYSMIHCDCDREDEAYVENIACASDQLQIIDDALKVFGLLHRIQIRKLFENYTDDEIALKLAEILGAIISNASPDRKYVSDIDKLRGKIIFVGSELREKG